MVEMYRDMLLIRRFEEVAGRQYQMGKVKGFCHLYIGQEAIAVGSISALRDDDFVVPEDTGTEVIWDGVIYDVTVTSKSDQSTTRYRGRAIITFRLEGNFYYIAKWEDQIGESNPDNPGQSLPTMGVLRGTFGSK